MHWDPAWRPRPDRCWQDGAALQEDRSGYEAQGTKIEPSLPPRYIAVMSTTTLPPAETTLSILMPPNPILRTRTRKVDPSTIEQVRALLPAMFATMYAAPGIGLAAPQVGVGLRFAVLDLMADNIRAPVVLINPEIIRVSEDWAVREEGCLSLPNQYADVSRPARVAVRYQDPEGATHEIEAEGLLSACLQHEIDHLDGVLFVDHLSALKRNMLMRKLAKEIKQMAAG